MGKYNPEVVLGMAVVLQNVVLTVTCGWVIVALYRASHSWHSLWPLLMLLAFTSQKFIRD